MISLATIGAAFDLGFSETIGEKVTEANQKGKILGGVCHGPLGFLKARGLDGEPLVKGRRVTGVTDKQVKDLRITHTPVSYTHLTLPTTPYV